MAESFLAKITPVEGPEVPVDPGYGRPVLPPLPGIWPPPGTVVPPIHYPPGGIALPPIYIDGSPEKPINLPPGLWPPLPPEIGGGPVYPGLPPTVGGGPITPSPPDKPGKDKAAILVCVIGLSSGDIWKGYRWYVFEKPPGEVGKPPEAGPKLGR